MTKKLRFCSVLAAVLLLFSVLCSSAGAAEYTYTVTLYSGNHAVFAGGEDSVTFSGLKKGEILNLSSALSGIQLEDESKYYVKGIRLSGRDNNTAAAASAFAVQGDAMYVVAYGLRGQMVAYTVNYQSSAGETLTESQTYYGNVGDKPVVAFLYMDGYQPQAYNLTKTLSDNAAENVFTFVYTPVETAAAPTPTPTPAPNAPDTEPAGENPNAPENPGGQNNNTPGGGEENLPNGSEEPNDNPNSPPEEIVDLDDNQTPLGDNPDGESSSGQSLLTPPAIAGICAGAVLLILLLFLLFWKRRKESGKT